MLPLLMISSPTPFI